MAYYDFPSHFMLPTESYTFNAVEQEDGTATSYLDLYPEPEESLATRIKRCLAGFISSICHGSLEDPVIPRPIDGREEKGVRFPEQAKIHYYDAEEGNRFFPVGKGTNRQAKASVSDLQLIFRSTDSEWKQKIAFEWASLQHEIYSMDLENQNPWAYSYEEARKTLEKLQVIQEKLSEEKYKKHRNDLPDCVKEEQHNIQKLTVGLLSSIADYENTSKRLHFAIGDNPVPFQGIIAYSGKRPSYTVRNKRYSNLKMALNNFPVLNWEKPVLVESFKGKFWIHPLSLHENVKGSLKAFQSIQEACSSYTQTTSKIDYTQIFSA